MDKDNLHLIRHRYIPEETTPLDSDEVLECRDDLIITRWKPINPRQDFAGGVSAFFTDKGWKISKICNCEGNVIYWYCDIIESIPDEENNTFTYNDLLFDVIVYPDTHIKVLDCDEAAEAFETGLITGEQLTKGLKAMNDLLYIIYHGRFDRLTAVIENAIK